MSVDIEKFINQIFNLGQTYWQQSDSQYASDNKKSDKTFESFQNIKNQFIVEFLKINTERDTLLAEREQWMMNPRNSQGIDKLLSKINDSQSNGWMTICKLLNELDPEWMVHGKTAIDCAELSIRSMMAKPSPVVAVPDLIIEALRQAVMVVSYRDGDVSTEDGERATTDTDCMIRLESALCEALGTKYDDIDLNEAIELLERLKTESINQGLLSASYARDALHWKSKFDQLMQSPRITEQDAMAEIKSELEGLLKSCQGNFNSEMRDVALRNARSGIAALIEKLKRRGLM